MIGRRLHVVHDWDSVVSLPEPTIVGSAAAVCPATAGSDEAASIEESEAFLSAYERARGRPWSADERQVCWAAGLWVRAFNARKEAVDGPDGPVQRRLFGDTLYDVAIVWYLLETTGSALVAGGAAVATIVGRGIGACRPAC